MAWQDRFGSPCVVQFAHRACAFVVIAFLAWGTYTERSTVGGQILPEAGLVKVYVPQAGIVLEKRVVEGQAVKKVTFYTCCPVIARAVPKAIPRHLLVVRWKYASDRYAMRRTRLGSFRRRSATHW
jgi:hypothetical protein